MLRLIHPIVFTLLIVTSLSASAKEVCRNETLKQINCSTIKPGAKEACYVTYVTVKVCKNVPDTRAGAAAAKAETVQKPDSSAATPPSGKVIIDVSKAKQVSP